MASHRIRAMTAATQGSRAKSNRGLSYVPALGTFLVIGGPVSRAPGPFELWRWSGQPGSATTGTGRAGHVTRSLKVDAFRALLIADPIAIGVRGRSRPQDDAGPAWAPLLHRGTQRTSGLADAADRHAMF